jgi:PBP1b-binding outer membrane lipoprotein LpoB
MCGSGASGVSALCACQTRGRGVRFAALFAGRRMLPASAIRFTMPVMSIRTFASGLLALAIAFTAACAGTRDTRVNPDAPDTVTGTGLQSQDIRTIASQMAADIKATGVLAPTREGERASFYIAPLVNESSDTINTALIPTTIRTEIYSAFGRTVKIIDRAPEANDRVDAENRMKEAGRATGTAASKVAGSDFVLKGRMQSRDRQAGKLKSSWIVVTLELTALTDGELIWTKAYDMKTESEKSVINR